MSWNWTTQKLTSAIALFSLSGISGISRAHSIESQGNRWALYNDRSSYANVFILCEYSQVLSLPRAELILIVWGWPQPFDVHRLHLPGVFIAWIAVTRPRVMGRTVLIPRVWAEMSDTRLGTIANKKVPWYGMCCGLKTLLRVKTISTATWARSLSNDVIFKEDWSAHNTKSITWLMRYSPDLIISLCPLPAGLMLLRDNHGGQLASGADE